MRVARSNMSLSADTEMAVRIICPHFFQKCKYKNVLRFVLKLCPQGEEGGDGGGVSPHHYYTCPSITVTSSPHITYCHALSTSLVMGPITLVFMLLLLLLQNICQIFTSLSKSLLPANIFAFLLFIRNIEGGAVATQNSSCRIIQQSILL